MSTAAFIRSKLLSRVAARASTRSFCANPTASIFQVSSFKKGTFSVLEQGRTLVSSRRHLSSSPSQTLKDILARELDEEVGEGNDQMPEELAELKSTIEKDWKIVDDGATTRLHRTVGSGKVVVSFHCQDTVEDAEEVMGEEVEDEEPAVPFRFEILISKAGNTMVIGCISNAGETTIDGISMTNEDAETIQANGIGRSKYQGPEFPELEEDLQNAFHDYVEVELGVNEDVSAFVSMYADYKEQKEYVNFLKDASKVIS